MPNDNPFSELIEVLKHNGYTTAQLAAIPGPQFFNLLKKGGWDQAWSGVGFNAQGKRKSTHILQALLDPTRGPPCGIIRLIDFARALETGFQSGPSEWISHKYRALFIVNFQSRGFVTFIPTDRDE